MWMKMPMAQTGKSSTLRVTDAKTDVKQQPHCRVLLCLFDFDRAQIDELA